MHSVSQWLNLRHLCEPLGGAKGLLEAVSFKVMKSCKCNCPLDRTVAWYSQVMPTYIHSMIIAFILGVVVFLCLGSCLKMFRFTTTRKTAEIGSDLFPGVDGTRLAGERSGPEVTETNVTIVAGEDPQLVIIHCSTVCRPSNRTTTVSTMTHATVNIVSSDLIPLYKCIILHIIIWHITIYLLLTYLLRLNNTLVPQGVEQSSSSTETNSH